MNAKMQTRAADLRAVLARLGLCPTAMGAAMMEDPQEQAAVMEQIADNAAKLSGADLLTVLVVVDTLAQAA